MEHIHDMLYNLAVYPKKLTFAESPLQQVMFGLEFCDEVTAFQIFSEFLQKARSIFNKNQFNVKEFLIQIWSPATFISYILEFWYPRSICSPAASAITCGPYEMQSTGPFPPQTYGSQNPHFNKLLF